jgi:hypothetical protein
MADLPITEITPASPVGDAWEATLFLDDGTEKLELGVEFSDTQRCIAGLAEPTTEWIAERARVCAPLLDNHRPVIEQVREWEQPLRLFAERP